MRYLIELDITPNQGEPRFLVPSITHALAELYPAVRVLGARPAEEPTKPAEDDAGEAAS